MRIASGAAIYTRRKELHKRLRTVVTRILAQKEPEFVFVTKSATSDVPSADVAMAETFVAAAAMILRHHTELRDPAAARRFKVSEHAKAIMGYDPEDWNGSLALAIGFAFLRGQKKYPALTASRPTFQPPVARHLIFPALSPPLLAWPSNSNDSARQSSCFGFDCGRHEFCFKG
ncbi:hypothetical protein CONLIGDRAFT_677992 [Coniochaeta ligniaria NRRL 30616]|uniref:Uncharacterized protein n=1 Tax=Coniochaeta ligniaria NRRL 30616 TaxID=1408157 RepID=A0A1J7IV14_9PEZI|nr:hypothetical protein CONLIGDRAFT_677992 [Coniochaeta ligniaria NRRL 30616]